MHRRPSPCSSCGRPRHEPIPNPPGPRHRRAHRSHRRLRHNVATTTPPTSTPTRPPPSRTAPGRRRCTPATASSSTWRSAARRSRCSTELADDFNNGPDAEVNGRCVFVRPRSVASGLAASLIPEGWPNPEANGVPPVIWSPAASGWGGIVNERAGRRVGAGRHPVHADATRHCDARADGRGDRLPGRADRVRRPRARSRNDPEGWASVGHPEWGPFRLGKTNPNYSTSGLNFTIAEYYAATGKTSGLTTEDLARPAAVEFATDIESSVVHYGDITMTFLNNWFAADVRGHVADLRQRRGRRGEERHRLQPRQSRWRAVAGRGAAGPTSAAGRDLPRGGHALLGQPVHHPRHRMGRRRRAGGGRAVRGLRADSRRTRQR